MSKYLKYIVFFLLLFTSVDSYSQKKKKKEKKAKTEKNARNLEFQYYFHDAIREKMIGNYMSAIAIFQKCVELESEESAVHYALSELYANIGRLQESYEHGEKSVKLDGANKFYKLNYALIALQVGKYKEAVKAYQELLKNDPENLEYLFQYSECLTYLNEIEDVLIVYAKIEELVGVYKELSVRKYEIYRQLKKPEKAIAELQKLIDSSPGNTDYYQYLIDYYNSLGEKEKAFQTLEIMIQKNPENGYAQIKLSEYYMNIDQVDKALNALLKAFSGTTVDIDTKVKLLITLFDLSENNQNLKMTGYQLLDSLTKYHPEDAKSYSIKGDFLLRDSRNSEAQRAFKKASTLDETRFAIWKQLVLLDAELQRYDEMWEDAENASDNFPSQPMFYLYQGMAGLKIGNYEKSAELLDFGKNLVVNDEKLSKEFKLYLAEALFRSNEYEKSFKLYETLLAGNETDHLLMNNYAYYLALANMNLERATELSLGSNKLNPNVSTYQDTYAYILFRKGQYESALTWAEKALQNASYRSGTILEHLGDIYYKLEDIEKAVKFWTEANEFKDHSSILEQKIKDKKYYEAK